MAPPVPYDGFDLMPIAGEWRRGSSGERRADVDPWSGETLVEIPLAAESDLDQAYQAAGDAQREWASRPPAARAQVMLAAAETLRGRREEIVGWLVRESGGTVAKAELECDLVLGGLMEAASVPHRVLGRINPSDIPGKESRIYRVPAGVIAVISPWNFPLQLSNRSLAPALAAGNAVVLKPASDTPISGGLLHAKILDEAGLPPALLSVLVGTGTEIGDAMVRHPVPSVVSFTGSTPVGEGIARQAPLKRLALELGGNGPLIVLADADLDRAVPAAVFGSLFHQGQICMIANRIILEDAIHEEFLERFLERVAALKVGDPSDPETALGPVINHSQLEAIRDKIARSLDGGAEQLLGGDPGGPSGLLLPPHVLLADNEAPVAREEVFGPVATVLRAQDAEEALAIANDTEYGLSSAIFTADVERGVRLAQRLQAGMTHINDSPVNDDPNTAFGGEKASGVGRFGGDWAIEEFTTDHWISVQHEPREYPI
ncbi:MAG: aldehyde dehydrogenase family protein [Solirubrobacterales bacterium]|nr:aldehyde dehydrogenase family protein [Solirubrobacterales bacterium]